MSKLKAIGLLIMLAGLANTAGDCHHDNSTTPDPVDSQHATTTVLCVASFLDPPWDDYWFGAKSVVRYKIFDNLNVTVLLPVGPTPPPPTAYPEEWGSLYAATCTKFFTNINRSRSECGVPAMLLSYARHFRWVNGMTDTTASYRRIEFLVYPSETEVGGLYELGVTPDEPAGVDSAYLYTAAWVFRDGIRNLMTLWHALPSDTAYFEQRALAVVMAHELGHHVLGFGEAYYDSTPSPPENFRHNMSGPRCIMAAPMHPEDLLDPNYPLLFCKDTDSDPTNSCWDNRFRVVTP